MPEITSQVEHKCKRQVQGQEHHNSGQCCRNRQANGQPESQEGQTDCQCQKDHSHDHQKKEGCGCQGKGHD